jgi:hypothetical protein
MSKMSKQSLRFAFTNGFLADAWITVEAETVAIAIAALFEH